MNIQQAKPKLAVIVPLFFIVLYLVPLGWRDLWSPDELRYAEIAREMVSSGNWIAPTFNDLRYFEKPVMGHWMNAMAQIFFGENNFSVRAASSISTLVSGLFLFFLVRRFANKTQAWVTVAIYLSLLLVVTIASYSVLDGMLNLWLTAAFTAFFFAANADNTGERFKHYSLAGLYCACAFLTKGFLAWALPVIVVLPFMIWEKKTREILSWGFLVFFVALLVSAPWALAIHKTEPDFWHYFFWIEHVKRFTADDAQHSSPVWYYLALLPIVLLPWTFLAPSSISHLKGSWNSSLLRYALLWALIPFLFFSIAKGKLISYILPCMAPIAVLLAAGLIRAVEQKAKGLNIGTIFNFIFISLSAVAAVVYYKVGPTPLQADEYYRPWLLLAAFAFWAGLAVVSLKSKSLDARVATYMMMPLGLFMVISGIFPESIQNAKMPAGFIQEVKPLINKNTVLIADYPTTMSALNWYLKRSDVYLTGSKGEVEYGLEYPDAKDRFIEANQLANFIVDHEVNASVAIAFRKQKIPTDLPDPDKLIKKGEFTLLYYKQGVGQ